ncbi:Rrf2 family transcriptional regulator [Lysinibacter sp. HNR]|uniref:RrF2 family transcriptional regulator n=1 Tax=Lysinibacter sp. HNR TaxID=3031408 RepID=UPI0024350EEC|nr:Rrf2 family transcriptional regulator [Lysinibacter sp. HNR]WGD38578.1 Rrf2 family transcriptional regulator [Lysinibacter sp. HNR]
MKISAYTDVSLRAMLVLATLKEGEMLSSREIAAAVGTPFNHVSKTVSGLSRLGFVSVTRGRHGGARLNEAGRAATVGQVIRLLSTREDVADCMSPRGDCPLAGDCRLRHALNQAREAFLRELDDIVVAELPTRTQAKAIFATIGLHTAD